MASVNKVILIGNLGKDPEIKYTPSGMAVARFSLATNERTKDKDGNWGDRTEWHNIVLFERKAEIAGLYFHAKCGPALINRLVDLAQARCPEHKVLVLVLGA